MLFAVDTGGTFTDLVVREADGTARMFKSPTTPDDPIRGVLDVLAVAADADGSDLADFLGRGERLIHGTTHALNAVVTGKTAKTALLVTEGHPDILALREGGRAGAFDFTSGFPEPYIPRSLTFELPERIRADGSIVAALNEPETVRIIDALKAENVEAVAVCLLWSIANGVHEERVGALLETHLPDVPYTLSHKLNPAVREFRRASSAAIDASLKPLMGAYMRDLDRRLAEAGFNGRTLVVTSQAGVIDAADAAEAPIHVVNSGPSMAPIAGRHYAEIDEGAEDAIVADTGGTTYDVSLVRKGEIPTTRETWIGPKFSGTMIGFPWVDVKSVGAGGGSIAWVDAGNLLHVGPQSAGAVPGPAAYARGGTEPTVTDASLVLGHLDAENFLGGAMELDVDAAREAVRVRVAEPLGLSLEKAADAILTLATENMVQAIADITVSQGIDPSQAVLIGGGGAAGINSVRIARRLGCARLLIPNTGPTLSAAGASMSDLKADFRAARFVSTADFDFDAAMQTLGELTARARDFIEGAGRGAVMSSIRYAAEARYATQVWEIETPLPSGRIQTQADLDAFVHTFHHTHRNLFTFDDPNSPIDIIGWKAEAICSFGERKDLGLQAFDTSGDGTTMRRHAWFDGIGWSDVPVHDWNTLHEGDPVEGAAIIESPLTTVVIDPGAVAELAPSGGLSIRVEA